MPTDLVRQSMGAVAHDFVSRLVDELLLAAAELVSGSDGADLLRVIRHVAP